MNELPVGRRVAQWRVRRNMTQQQFADCLGKSKSWVDKIERGVRRLERVSNLREIAETLRIDVEVLLATRPVRPTPVATGVDGIRTALARYHLPDVSRPPPVEELWPRLEHAEQSYRHARYAALLALLPGLLDAVREAHAVREAPAAREAHAAREAQAAREARAAGPGATDALLVSVYALIALVLVKVDQGELAWLAADRAMAVALATHDPRLAAVATVALSQALRSRGRRRSALEAALAAADRVGAFRAGDESPVCLSLRGTLLIQAALAAAGGKDQRRSRRALDQATEIASELGAEGARAGGDRIGCGRADGDRAGGGAGGGTGGAGFGGAGFGGAGFGGGLGGGGFGRAAVEAARVVAEAALGEVTTAMARHERLMAGEEWRWLPPEHRAAYLLDVARAHALTGDARRAGRTLLDAERTAHSEVHDRPVVRRLVTVVWRSADAPAGIAQLATILGVA